MVHPSRAKPTNLHLSLFRPQRANQSSNDRIRFLLRQNLVRSLWEERLLVRTSILDETRSMASPTQRRRLLEADKKLSREQLTMQETLLEV